MLYMGRPRRETQRCYTCRQWRPSAEFIGPWDKRCAPCRQSESVALLAKTSQAPDLEGEMWRPVVGWEDIYEVSSEGRVRALTRIVNHCSGGRIVYGHLVKPQRHKAGYVVAPLGRGDRVTTYLVHRLVAEAFIGPCPVGHEVNHKNLNKKDNRADNVEYVTRSENLLHRSRAGIGRGESNGTAVLTSEQVHEIRRRHNRGEGYKRIARELGHTWGSVRAAATGRTWAWLEEPNNRPGRGGPDTALSEPV